MDTTWVWIDPAGPNRPPVVATATRGVPGYRYWIRLPEQGWQLHAAVTTERDATCWYAHRLDRPEPAPADIAGWLDTLTTTAR